MIISKTEMPRTLVFTDIHGCYEEFKSLLFKVKLTRLDTVIFLGDYVDRGKDSKKVLDEVARIKDFCHTITLLGNHECLMIEALLRTDKKIKDYASEMWVRNGGLETLKSYGLGVEALDYGFKLPRDLEEHLWMLRDMPLYYETDTHIFVHASPRTNEDISEQDEMDLLWRRVGSVEKLYGYDHISGKTIICGHTAQPNGEPKFLSDKNIIIDTGCFFTGVLTCAEVKKDSINFINFKQLN